MLQKKKQHLQAEKAQGAAALSEADLEKMGVTVIRMPLLSDTMTEGVIAEWHKKVGDKVKDDDILADVETDKATMEVMGYAYRYFITYWCRKRRRLLK